MKPVTGHDPNEPGHERLHDQVGAGADIQRPAVPANVLGAS